MFPPRHRLWALAFHLMAGTANASGDTLFQMMGNPSGLVSPGHWRMLWDILRFFRTARAQSQRLDERITAWPIPDSNGYSRAFMYRHLLPMAGAIWSSSPNQMLDYPALSFLKFLGNHGLLQYNNRPQWRTVTGGSREYVERLLEDSRFRVLTGYPVHRLERSEAGVVLQAGSGYRERFDHVVIATHADQALAMLREPIAGSASACQPFAMGATGRCCTGMPPSCRAGGACGRAGTSWRKGAHLAARHPSPTG